MIQTDKNESQRKALQITAKTVGGPMVPPENHSRTWFVKNNGDASRREFWPMSFEKTRSTVNFLPDGNPRRNNKIVMIWARQSVLRHCLSK